MQMRNWVYGLLAISLAMPAHAEFTLSTAVIEFTNNGTMQQDIELTSRSNEEEYIENELYEITNPGQENEARQLVENPVEAGMMVTPDKAILAGNGRRLVRFVLLNPPGEREKVFRATIKPVVNDIVTEAKMGLKLLIGYEVLVIVRPATITPDFSITRAGREVTVMNRGNSNILIEPGRQCPSGVSEQEQCKSTSAMRVYAGTSTKMELPFDAPVTYHLWDGRKNSAREVK